jgi:ATP-dependent DNA helicase DinG
VGILELSDNLQPTGDDFIKNFPFLTLRERQSYVLNEIAAAFASGYKYIVLEAPTGFGKSPVAIAVALTLGTSYICTSTKDLQTQYARDFPFLKVTKGKNNFICAVKDDFIRNGTHKCGLCVSKVEQCYHTTADYGPCINNTSFKYDRCKYRTFDEDYTVDNKGTREEKVFIGDGIKNYHQNEYSQWLHPKNLKKELRVWRPCEYYDQLNIALVSSHAIFNYSIFLALLTYKIRFPTRNLLILDEAHLLESEIVKFKAISISKRRWKRYIPDFKMVDYGYNDIEKWIEFLIDLETEMLVLIGKEEWVEKLAIYRRETYNWISKKDSFNEKKIEGASDIFESDKNEDEHIYTRSSLSEELTVEATRDTNKLAETINNILSNPGNWIVSDIKKENNNEVTKVELKPLDVSLYCRGVFGSLRLCDKILMMSATILDKDTFCKSLGLASEDVKFIQVPSDFPLQNRPIIPLNIEYLNHNNLQKQDVQIKVARAIDNLMTLHRNDKGIIHTTSYKQLNFIKENISQTNKRRLIVTDPKIPRDEVITEHVHSTKPTVLISPSLYLGLDLKDDLSRFQIITKVPYPDLGDRWINEKRKKNGQWYTWQTALRLVQGYGRSIRSNKDWAITYVLDSGFVNFVKKNSNILPDWFTQAIVDGMGFNSNKVPATTKENHNPVTNNQCNSSIASKQQHVNNNIENEIASTAIPIKPLDLENSATLDSNDKDERLEQRLFICPYCPKLNTTSEIEYQRHIVLKHPGKPGYPNMAVA